MMRERLTDLIKQGDKKFADKYEGKIGELMSHIDEVFGFVADYLIANGVVVPPCKVGDKVYRISASSGARIKYIQETKVSRIAIDNEGIWIFCTCNPIAKTVFGKTVFLSREDAEKALRGDKG